MPTTTGTEKQLDATRLLKDLSHSRSFSIVMRRALYVARRLGRNAVRLA